MVWIVNDSEGVAFATVNVTQEKRDLTKIKCYRCNKKGHFANHLPENENDAKAPSGAEVTTEALQQLVLAEPPDGYDAYDDINNFNFLQPRHHVNPN
jgi:hypothetical protein